MDLLRAQAAAWRPSSSSTSPRAPPARCPARASSCRACSVQASPWPLHGNENRFQYGDRDAHRPAPALAAACAVAARRLRLGRGRGRPPGRSWRPRPRPPTSRATWRATAPRCAGCWRPTATRTTTRSAPGRREGAGARARSSSARAATSTRGSTARSTAPAPTRPVLDLLDRVGRRGRRPALVAGPAPRRARGRRRSAPRWRRPTRGRRRLRGQRAARYATRLRALDAAVARCIGQIPAGAAQARHHARRARLLRAPLRPEVVGTVIPSLSTQAQASAGDLAELVDTIRRERVRAIFAESSVNAKVEDAIAQETGARVGRPLWADSLGPAGSERRDLRGLDPGQHRRDRRGPDGRREDVLVARADPRRALHAARDRRARCCSRCWPACSAPGSCCAGSPSTRTRSGRRRSPGWSSPCRGAWRRSWPRWRPRSASAPGIERLSRGRRMDPGAATGLLLVAALAIGIVLASDVYESGAGVDRLLFGTLIGLSERDVWLTAAAVVAALARARRAAPRVAGRPASTRAAPARSGVRTALADRVLLAAVAVAVVVSLDAVGALLVAVVLVVPAATVRLVARDVRTLQLGTAALAAAEGLAALLIADALDVGPGPGDGGARRRSCSRVRGGGEPMSLVRTSTTWPAATRPAATRSRTSRSRSRRARWPACSGPTAAARRRCSARCSASCRSARGTVELAGRPAYVPQTEHARLDFPVSALDVALMGAYRRTPFYRRLGRGGARGRRGGAGARRARRPRPRALRHALRRPAPARADRPRARPGRAACCCSTSRCRASTRRAPRGSRRCCASCATRAARCWSPPTTSSRRAASTASCACTGARSRSARPAEVLTRAPCCRRPTATSWSCSTAARAAVNVGHHDHH